MKKFFALFIAFAFALTLTACGEEVVEEGDYTPGVYFGYSEGHQNSFAVLTVDENGYIVGLLVDTVYMKSEEGGPVSWVSRGNDVEGIATTKRSLDGGCGYDMHRSGTYCEAPEGQFMWHEQVDLLTQAVIEAQGLPSLPILENNTIDQDHEDAIAGVTITVDTYIEAIQDALNQASE